MLGFLQLVSQVLNGVAKGFLFTFGSGYRFLDAVLLPVLGLFQLIPKSLEGNL